MTITTPMTTLISMTMAMPMAMPMTMTKNYLIIFNFLFLKIFSTRLTCSILVWHLLHGLQTAARVWNNFQQLLLSEAAMTFSSSAQSWLSGTAATWISHDFQHRVGESFSDFSISGSLCNSCHMLNLPCSYSIVWMAQIDQILVPAIHFNVLGHYFHSVTYGRCQLFCARVDGTDRSNDSHSTLLMFLFWRITWITLFRKTQSWEGQRCAIGLVKFLQFFEQQQRVKLPN